MSLTGVSSAPREEFVIRWEALGDFFFLLLGTSNFYSLFRSSTPQYSVVLFLIKKSKPSKCLIKGNSVVNTAHPLDGCFCRY